ncbi:tetraspanin-11 isoform X8 [Pristis pectinata]|uniref:tetraspanin-11 isoform X8 n=1 Tax=Pristis pectinata TaxID=685728 RepID=UPI00223E6E8B|nr:tetraspanin-11 isoform X8 [Pristis pectinata]
MYQGGRQRFRIQLNGGPHAVSPTVEAATTTAVVANIRTPHSVGGCGREVAGAGVLLTGTWTLNEKRDYLSLLPSSTFAVSACILVFAGSLVTITGFLGCCAVVREQKSALVAFKCCGSNNSADWQYSVYILSPDSGNRVVPDSCCKTVTEACGQRDHPSNVYKVEGGCLAILELVLADHLLIMGAVGIGVACLQLIGAVTTACFICVLIKEEEEEEEYFQS